MEPRIRALDLRGKDDMTIVEAAHYGCLSVSHFRAQAPKLGLEAFSFAGNKIYRKADLKAAMEMEWRLSAGSANERMSVGVCWLIRVSVAAKR